MSDILAPLLPEYTIEIPKSPLVLVIWGIWFGLLVYFVIRFRDRELKIDRRTLIFLALLSVLVLVLTPFFGLKPPWLSDSAPPNALPIYHLMFLAAVPWMVTSGLLGTILGVVLAGMSGLFLAYLDTHQVFTPLILMTLALFFSWFVNQRYRTRVFRWLCFPLMGAVTSLFITLPLIFLSIIVTLDGSFSQRIGETVNLMPPVIFSIGGMMLIGGVVCVILRAMSPKNWGTAEPLKTAPGEISLKFRLLTTIVPVLLILWIILALGMWFTNLNAVKRDVVQRLTSSANLVTDEFSLFIDTGNETIGNLSNRVALQAGTPEQAASLLDMVHNTITFFESVAVLDANGIKIAAYPTNTSLDLIQAFDGQVATSQVIDGGKLQVLPSQPTGDLQDVQWNFLTGIRHASGEPIRILWGQTTINDHPLVRTAINLLQDHEKSGGTAFIVNQAGVILYHTDSSQISRLYTGEVYNTATYFEGKTVDGTAHFQLYQPIKDTGCFLVSTTPTQIVYESTWQSTYPILLFGLGFILLIIFVLLLGISPLTRSMDRLMTSLKSVAKGDYDFDLAKQQPLGEMGQLNEVFMGVAGSLRNRMLKQNDLFYASQGVAGQRDLGSAMDAIMKSALAQGVSSVRIVLSNSAEDDSAILPRQSFGLGKHTQSLAVLDRDVLARTRSGGPLILSDYQIEKIFSVDPGIPSPASLIAIPLKWENTWLGVLWVTFQDYQSPETDDIDFFKALSQKASMAIVSIRSLNASNTVRRQMEAVLDVIPDLLLIVDEDELVVYHNQKAQIILGSDNKSLIGVEYSSLFKDKEPIEFLTHGEHSANQKEIQLEDGSVYHQISSPVQLTDGKMGKVIVLRNITDNKITDSMRAEYVTTVSHELRSPLTLIHGYAKILRLTGNLNEQQDATVRKIIAGIEEMKHLVQNLLDIDRLETDTSLEMTKILISEFAQKVLNSMEVQARQKNIQMKLTLSESPLSVEADETFLTQALKNLLDNAIKFSKMGGEVGLAVRMKDDHVVFAVRDEGIGIAPLDQRHIFNKFQRTSTPLGQENSGSGLGLAIVRSIAERHGGRVWLESQLGKGSTFYLEIPDRQN